MKQVLFILFLLGVLPLQAQEITKVRYVGPYTVQSPVLIDSINAAQTKYSADQVLDTPISIDNLKQAQEKNLADIQAEKGTLNLLGFTFNTSSYVKTTVKVEGAKSSKVYINGKESRGEEGLIPGVYQVAVKYLADTASVKIRLQSDKEEAVQVQSTADGTKRLFTLDDNMHMKRYGSVSVSPTGKYAFYTDSWLDDKGKSVSERKLKDLTTGRILLTSKDGLYWMPKTDRYYAIRTVDSKSQMVVVDPADGKEEVLVSDLPSTSFSVSPNEDFLILYNTNEGPAKEKDVYEILTPDDRQPGWRSRSSLSKMDLSTGLVQPLTYGYHNVWLSDISRDGNYMLLHVSSDSLTQMRPTSLSTIYRMNLKTLEMEKLVDKDGFIYQSLFLPDANQILLTGSPECLNGVGKNVMEGQTPNTYDYQMYVMDLPTRKVTPLTRDFNPSISTVQVNFTDGNIYFTAENKDSVTLYRMNTKNWKIQQLPVPLDLVNGFSMADYGINLALYGNSTCIPDRLYCLNTKNLKCTMLEDLNADRFAEIQLGTVKNYRMTCKRGYEVTGFYYLPANFDETKKYPVILDYYGGCSPTTRRFGGGSHYPAHYWNALGYIVLVVNPSGCTGFGQEWAARHVNTMGEGVAEDMIEFAQAFAKEMPFADEKKFGCVSASYGGFMTQCMLSKTDFFAAGISHAGISDHTSYWGEGYWGYSYSQTSAANSYPWTRKDLYVDRSPLYNADKIHTPLLFTHGTADTNVPIGESIQMYTALKLLGVPTAFVMVEGQDHGIYDYGKRIKWINTMMAWFQKYLKGDSSWWEAIYTPKKL